MLNLEDGQWRTLSWVWSLPMWSGTRLIRRVEGGADNESGCVQLILPLVVQNCQEYGGEPLHERLHLQSSFA